MRQIVLWAALFCGTTRATGQAVPSDVRARAAILVEAQTGKVLKAKNPDLQLPPASTTKIMTAWLFARDVPPAQTVPISANAAHTPPTALGMKPGETYTARDLLHAMLLTSANDACIAAAEQMEGSVPAFIAHMNAETQALGAKNTHFANPNGLPDPAHYSTARDLATIARQAMQNPAFAAAVRTREYALTRPDGRMETLKNTNDLLWTSPDIEGIKTGWTKEAGYCFVGTSTRGGRQLITVVLDSPDWQADTLALLRPEAPALQPSAPPAGAGIVTPNETAGKAPTGPAADRGNSKPKEISFWPLWALPALLLARLLWRWSRLGEKFAMSKFRFPLSSMLRATPRVEPHPPVDGAAVLPNQAVVPQFTFVPTPFQRGTSAEWLEAATANPTRLLEPPNRRLARPILDANPTLGRTPLLALLSHAQPKLRVAAADLLLPYAPHQAEAILRDMADDGAIPAEVRAEAVQILGQSGGNRHEELFRQILLREGSPAAARALISLPELHEETTKTFLQALRAPSETKHLDLRSAQQRALLACILANRDLIPAEEAAEHLKKVPLPQRETLFGSTLQGQNTEWAVSQLVETALHSGSQAAMQALLDSDPQAVRTALQAQRPTLDTPTEARATVLEWLLLEEGDGEVIRQMAEADNAIARSARQLSLAHHWQPEDAEPDALLAAAQITSLRLGFSPYSPEQIANLFRTSASGEPDKQALTETPELASLAQAYADPQVHTAVQNAMHLPHGPERLTAELMRRPESAAYQTEMAFWCDKTDRATRLPLVRTLSDVDSPPIQNALAKRASDSCPQVRRLAFRARRQSLPVPQEQAPLEEAADTALDAAA